MLSLQIGHYLLLQPFEPQTRSIFPKLEIAMRRDETGVIKFLGGVIDENTDGDEEEPVFRSDGDFFYIWCFPSFMPSCMKYYRGEGPLLKDILTEGERDNMGSILLAAFRQMQHTLRNYSWMDEKQKLIHMEKTRTIYTHQHVYAC